MIEAAGMGFIPAEFKPSGAKMEHPETGLTFTVDTLALAVVQELNSDGNNFLNQCVALNGLVRKVFLPLSVVRNGFALKLRQDFPSSDAMIHAFSKLIDDSQKKLAVEIGMTASYRNLDYWFKSGSRTLHILLQPNSLQKVTKPIQVPNVHASPFERKRLERQNVAVLSESLRYALVFEIDLMEDDPPENSNLEEHFAEMQRIADIGRKRMTG
jgi:hypothetical protein